MTHQKILEKAIKKAIDGGWRPLADGRPTHIHQWKDKVGGAIAIATIFPDRDSEVTWVRELEGIIFNHDFAKALWGDEFKYFVARDGRGTSVGEIEYAVYKYRLQQMVIADDPIKYLGENV